MNVHAEDPPLDDVLLRQAENGDSAAQARLALHYEKGIGREKNEEQAMRWLRAAAESGNPLAQSKLGSCFREGRMVKKNLEEGFKWTKMAAENGDFLAQLALGECYRTGDGIPKSNVKAYMWFDILASTMLGSDVLSTKFRDHGKERRNTVAKEMTQGEIAEAESLSDEWIKRKIEQAGAGQPATAPESKPNGKDKPKPESKPAPR